MIITQMDSRASWFFKPRSWGYSFMVILNMLLLQWFCVRMYAVLSLTGCGCFKIGVIGFVVPMTGWWSNYVWIKKVW